MTTLPEIAAAFSSAKAAIDIVKGMISLKSQVEVQSKAAELLTIIIDLKSQMQAAQVAHAALEDRCRQLEREARERQRWDQDKTNYLLHRLTAGGVVFRFKAPAGDPRPQHDLCVLCAEKDVRSVLQPSDPVGWTKTLKCHACGSVVMDERIEQPFSVGAHRRDGWEPFT